MICFNRTADIDFVRVLITLVGRRIIGMCNHVVPFIKNLDFYVVSLHNLNLNFPLLCATINGSSVTVGGKLSCRRSFRIKKDKRCFRWIKVSCFNSFCIEVG